MKTSIVTFREKDTQGLPPEMSEYQVIIHNNDNPEGQVVQSCYYSDIEKMPLQEYLAYYARQLKELGRIIEFQKVADFQFRVETE